jgi:Ca2+-binding RTX toxin-like protein
LESGINRQMFAQERSGAAATFTISWNGALPWQDTERADDIIGSAGADSILAHGGNDIIRAGLGNDDIGADAGDDTVTGMFGGKVQPAARRGRNRLYLASCPPMLGRR